MYRSKLTLRHKEALTGLMYAALPLLGFAVFYFIPFGITIKRTFTGGLATNKFIGLANYINVLQSQAFRLAAGNTLRFIAIGVPLLMLLALMIALLLNMRLKGGFRLPGADAFRAAYVLPLILPTASVIMVFQIIFETGGIINYLLNKLGLDTVVFLRSANAFWILLLLYIWKNVGYGIILTLAGLTQIPKEYYEAANIDGANSISTLAKITLPLMAPTFFFVMIISIVGAFKSFREAFALGGEYPHDSIYMLQHFMNNNFARLNYARLSVAAVLTFLMIFAFVLVMFIWRGKGGVALDIE